VIFTLKISQKNNRPHIFPSGQGVWKRWRTHRGG